jgi:hypothetical protein
MVKCTTQAQMNDGNIIVFTCLLCINVYKTIFPSFLGTHVVHLTLVTDNLN